MLATLLPRQELGEVREHDGHGTADPVEEHGQARNSTSKVDHEMLHQLMMLKTVYNQNKFNNEK